MRKALDMERLRDIYDRASMRYDFQHAFFTAMSDQRGRMMLIERAVHEGGTVLDAGAGTGSTALLAAEKVGPHGKVLSLDMSVAMLEVAKEKLKSAGLADRMLFKNGDIEHLPFEDEMFDTVLSTYSMCPLRDPARGALELYRVVKPGGHIGIAHSADPETPVIKWLADKIEDAVWRMPMISLGCRSVSVLPSLVKAGGTLIFTERIGIPLWPFMVFVVEKPAA